jgi:hypothetical protein
MDLGVALLLLPYDSRAKEKRVFLGVALLLLPYDSRAKEKRVFT